MIDYKGGRILHIKLTDFMTYDNFELFPGPGLNLIIGPNGSGKSTVVCAICLGLGGKPVFAGRNMSLRDFIKHGKKKAVIEISLDDPENSNDLVIQRIIKDGSSQYSINDVLVREEKIQNEMSRFNIQTNNLCQFLPQERVSDFSKMNPVQWLENMQQAVGDPKLFQYHDELKNTREKCCQLEKQIAQKESLINTEENKNKQSAAEAKIFEQFQIMTRQLALLKEYELILEYQANRAKYQEKLEEKKEIMQKISSFQSSLEPQQKELKTVSNTISICKKDMGDLKATYNLNKSKMDKIGEKINDIIDQIDNDNQQMQHKIQRQQEVKAKIATMTRLINTLKDNLTDIENKIANGKKEYQSLSSNIEKTSQNVSDSQVELEKFKHELISLNYQRKRYEADLKLQSHLEHKKLETLKSYDFDTYKGLLWLKEHRSEFKKHIYDPILMELDIPNPNDIKYVENQIAKRDLIAFVCEDRQDMKLLTEKLRVEKRISINAVSPPDIALEKFQPQIPLNVIRKKYNLVSYLKDLCKAPDPILRFLCKSYNIHNVPVGNKNSEKCISDITRDCVFSRFYTPDSCHNVKRSKYGNKSTSLSTWALRRPKILGNFLSTSDQQQELEEKIKEIDKQILDKDKNIKTVEAQWQKHMERLEGLRQKKNEFKNLEEEKNFTQVQISVKTDTVKKYENDIVDANKLQKANSISMYKKRKEILKQSELEFSTKKLCFDAQKKIIVKHMKEFCLHQKEEELKASLKDKEKAFEDLKTKLEEIKSEVEKLKKITQQNLTAASEVLGVSLAENVQDVITKKYSELPSTRDKVESEINKLTARINCYGESDKQVYVDHQKRKKTIAQSHKDKQMLLAKLKSHQEDIKTKKHLWLTPLNQLIGKISDTFAEYFRGLNCAGEINLKVSENPDDFDKYGLSILVKFRDAGALQELSHARHSGGECSVSTIIFILALQKLTDVPFRCVDEINQGMDAINERRIFDLVSMSSGSSQYFLLTPKLLPDLNYQSEGKLHIIHNSPSIDLGIQWKIGEIVQNKLSKRRRSGI